MKRTNLLNSCAAAGALLLAATGPTWSMDDNAKMGDMPHAAATSAKAGQIEANELIGQSVKNAQGDTIGDIDSVLLDKDGKAVAAIVGVGGFLGMGEHEVAVNWDALDISNNGRQVRADYTKDQLKAMPEYRFSRPNQKSTAFYDQNYRVSDNSDMRKGTMSGTVGHMAATNGTDWSAMGPVGEVRASTLMGTDVVNDAGDTIGDIDEIVVGANGKPQLILSVGGFLGMGEHHVALDWTKVKLARDKDGIIHARLDMTKDQIQAMPEYKFETTTR